MATLTYLGHASFLFETQQAAILIDPWLSPRGAFCGTWRQLPQNDHTLPWAKEKLKNKPTLIYITHEHEDHYDEETLEQLLPLCQGLVIPNYQSKFFEKTIQQNLDFPLTLLDENKTENFHDISYKIFIDESGINRDSAIFLKARDFSFLNLNDCKIYDRADWLSENCGNIDVLTVQFSGANMHPICYDMSEEEHLKISRQKKMRKFVAVNNFIRSINPKCYIPSAGPAVFSLPEHYDLNFQKDSIFPKWWEFSDYLKQRKNDVNFFPLDVLGSISKPNGDSLKVEKTAQEISREEVEEIIAYYRKVDQESPDKGTFSTSEVISFFENEMREKTAVLKDYPQLEMSSPIFFEITRTHEETLFYKIDAKTRSLEPTSRDDLTLPYYLHSTSIDALRNFMISGKGWGTYFLAFQFRGERRPDVYNSVIATFLVANNGEELDFGLKKLVEFRENEELITLTSSDRSKKISCRRYCPHQGADLKYAQFDGRYVHCPRHQWKFDCERGGVADNSGDTIEASYCP